MARRRRRAPASGPPAARQTVSRAIEGQSQSPRTVVSHLATGNASGAASWPPLAKLPWPVAMLAVLVLVSYLPAMLWAGFVWDDVIFTDSKGVREWSGLWRIWFDPTEAIDMEGHYWPLVYSTFWLEHKLWGLEPAGYHIVNVLLHLANTVLLYRILGKLAVPGALLIAAVFAVHPLHVSRWPG